MKKYILKLVSILSISAVCFGSVPNAVVKAVDNDVVKVEVNAVESVVQEDLLEILGKSNNTTTISFSPKTSESNKIDEDNNSNSVQEAIPNKVSLDWVATENAILLEISNLGIDSVDLVSGTINTGKMNKSFAYTNVSPGKKIYSVTVPIQACREDIEIIWTAKDGASIFVSGTSTGVRIIPSSLLNLWGAGGRGSNSNNLDYHYDKHGSEVMANNICDYSRKADAFRYVVINDGLKPIKEVPGATPNVYRYNKYPYYIDVVQIDGQPSGELISYGKLFSAQ